jgi:hypothetical protein
MNPVHVGWALSTAGALIFFSLGLLVQGLRRSAKDRRVRSELANEARRLAGALAEAEARVESLERALDDERAARPDRERSAAAAAAEAAEAHLEQVRTQEKAALAAVTAALELERTRSAEATARCTALAAELVQVKGAAVQTSDRELEIARSVKDVAERSWSDVPALPPGAPAEVDAMTWEGKTPTPEAFKDALSDSRVRMLEQRLRTLQEQHVESGLRHRTSEVDGKRAISGAIGDLVLKLASKRGVHSAVLADAQGLPFTGVGLPRYHDGIAAYAGLIGQLTAHAHDFIPMSDVVRCYLYDDRDLAFCCWLFKVGAEGFTLSTLNSESMQNESVMRRTIADLCLALS